jgi:hypothetical protein
MPAKRATGDFRVLWVGAPSVLPIAGWRMAGGLAYATSRNGVPDLTASWPGTSRGTTQLLAQAIELVRRGDTAQVGHVLAPMGVRYIVTVQSPAPLDASPRDLRPLPADLRDGLASQLDLFPVDSSPQSAVYENAAWAPMRTVIPESVAAPARLDDPRVARTDDFGHPPPVLAHQSGPTTYTGTLAAPSLVEVAEAPSGHWQLSVGGHNASRQPAFASANLFAVTTAGAATLSYQTPLLWRLAYLIGAALWIAALALVIGGRRRTRSAGRL